jgi:putative zinc finger protein
MDHQGIEESDLVEAYVTNRLADAERAEFEAHLVDCPECLDRVEAAQGLAAGLRALGPPAVLARTPPSPRRWPVGPTSFALAASVTTVLALGWGVEERRRLGGAIEAERAARAAAEARAQELARRPPELPEPAVPVTPPARPPGPVPVLMLVATRGTDLPTLRLPRDGGPVILSVERESPPRFSRYAVRLSRDDGAEVFAGLFPPSSRDALVLALDAELLPPGTYALALEGETAGGRRAGLPGHWFRVVR